MTVVADPLSEFQDFCSGLTLDTHKPFELEPFQQAIFGDHLERASLPGCTETLVLINKKNGKTTSVGAYVDYHLLTVPNASIVVVASTVHQADELFRAAQGFIIRSDELRPLFEILPGRREIRVAGDDELGKLKVIAGKPDSADGALCTLAIVEEWHRHKDGGEVYELLRKGCQPRNGELICITTAGDDEDHPLGQARAKARQLPIQRARGVIGGKEIDLGAYSYSSTADRLFALHEWALTPDEDWQDPAVVKRANPASWQTVEQLLTDLESPTFKDWYFKRFVCGLWVRGEGAAIQPTEWDALQSRDVIPHDAPVFVGMDLAFKTDCSALVPLYWASDELRIIGTPVILDPPPGEARLDDRAVSAALRRLLGLPWDRAEFVRELAADNFVDDVERWADAIDAAEPHNVAAVVYDPNAGAAQLVQSMQREHQGVTWASFDQQTSGLVRADGRFMEAVRTRRIRHNGHWGMRQHVLNAVEKPVGRDESFFSKPSRGERKPMDALRAVSMAHDAAVAHQGTRIEAPRPKYSSLYGAEAYAVASTQQRPTRKLTSNLF